MTTDRRLLRVMAAGVVVGVLAAGCGSSTSSGPGGPGATAGAGGSSGGGSGSISVGIIGPLTGNRSSVGADMVKGAQVALSDIDANGGVMGHQVKLNAQDDAADPGDAVPAAQKEIQADKVQGMLGPTAFTASVVKTLTDRADMPILMWGGGAEFDRNTDPNFFRMSPSDTEQAYAMVLYAHDRGWNRVGIALGNGSADQSLAPGLKQAAQKLGMTITSQVTIAVGATSFNSEIQTLFSKHPQAVLAQFDIPSAGVLFGELQQQGLASTPWVASNLWFASEFVNTVGKKTAAGPIYIANSTAAGAGLDAYLKALKKKTGSSAPGNGDTFMWDAATAWALGVDEAKSFKTPAVNAGILKVTNPPGTICYDFATCSRLLKAGKDVDFNGASSAVDFDKYHNVFGPFAILRYNKSGVAQTTRVLSASEITTKLSLK